MCSSTFNGSRQPMKSVKQHIQLEKNLDIQKEFVQKIFQQDCRVKKYIFKRD